MSDRDPDNTNPLFGSLQHSYHVLKLLVVSETETDERKAPGLVPDKMVMLRSPR